MPMLPTKTLLSWTFGRGTVVSKLLHLLGTVVEALARYGVFGQQFYFTLYLLQVREIVPRITEVYTDSI